MLPLPPAFLSRLPLLPSFLRVITCKTNGFRPFIHSPTLRRAAATFLHYREEGKKGTNDAAPQDDELSVSRVNMNKDVSREVGLGRRHATPRHATPRDGTKS